VENLRRLEKKVKKMSYWDVGIFIGEEVVVFKFEFRKVWGI